MNEVLIQRHNEVVGEGDVTVHAGDFCWGNSKKKAEEYSGRLNGDHVFLRGSHDHWLPDSAHEMWSKRIDGQLVVVCHYPMLRWEASHYNSWQLYGHVHGRMELESK